MYSSSGTPLGWTSLILNLVLLLSLIPLTWAHNEVEPTYAKVRPENLNSLHFTEQSISLLTGSWSYYDRKLLISPPIEAQGRKTELPILFQEITGNNIGYGTVIGHFKIPEAFVGRRLAIYIPNQNAAYRVYFNGEFLVRLGNVADNWHDHSIENASRIVYFVPKTPHFTLSIQMSNFNTLRGGLDKRMHIGVAKTVNRRYQRIMMSIAMICGGVFGVGLFTTLFSIFRGLNDRDSQTVFVFGLFILFLALHNLFTAPYAYTAFLDVPWLWGKRFEYLFIYLAMIFFLSYMYLLDKKYLHGTVYCFSIFMLLFNIVVTLRFDQAVFERLAFYSGWLSLMLLVNFFYGFYITLKNKEKYSKFNLVAIIILCLSFIHDFLLTLHLIDSIHVSFISTSLYALLVMFQQSHHYAYQTKYTERLNHNLIVLNESLDLKVQQRTEQLHDLNEKLQYQIQIDALTGAYNRRALNEEILKRFKQVQQNDQDSLVFAMIDVDYFKNYNDYYGHLKGDAILQNLVHVISDVLPEQAYLARYGGEEFAIILYNLPLSNAQQIIQTVLDVVRHARFKHECRFDQKDYITVSIGMAWMDKTIRYDTIYELMKAADSRLYQAKQAGRDQIRY